MNGRIANVNKHSKTLDDLKWDEGAGSSMGKSYGHGCQKTTYNYRKNKRELAIAARTSYNIKAIFPRQIDLRISLAAEGSGLEDGKELVEGPFR